MNGQFTSPSPNDIPHEKSLDDSATLEIPSRCLIIISDVNEHPSMTTILHIADVHLRKDRPERMVALRRALSLAEDRDADLVTIGGDLFDRPTDVEAIRETLQSDLFADRPFEVLLIPGNHDIDAYRDDIYFGDSCTVVVDRPFDHLVAPDGDIRITGLPYHEFPVDELLLDLTDREPFDGPEALLFHGSLDAPIDVTSTGDEGTRRYFPVSESLLSALGFEYYLAGHYHSAHIVPFADGATFVYPGTPASTASGETGRRHAAFLDSDAGLSLVKLDTYHYVATSFTLVPGDEEGLLDDVAAWTVTHAHDAAEATVTVEGFTERKENDFIEALVETAEPATLKPAIRGVNNITQHHLYREFEAELAEMDWDEDTVEGVRRRTLEVMTDVATDGVI